MIGDAPGRQGGLQRARPAPGALAATGNAMGLGLASVTPEARKTFNLATASAGVVITKVDPNSDAADKGLQPGDVVLKVGSRIVSRRRRMSRPAWPKPRRAAARACCCWWRTARAASRLCRRRYRPDMISYGRRGEASASGPPRWRQARPPACRWRGPILSEGVHRMRILVVEDDLEAQRYLVQGLKESGHVVDDAADGDTGPDRWRCRGPMTWRSSTACCPRWTGWAWWPRCASMATPRRCCSCRRCPKWMTG